MHLCLVLLRRATTPLTLLGISFKVTRLCTIGWFELRPTLITFTKWTPYTWTQHRCDQPFTNSATHWKWTKASLKWGLLWCTYVGFDKMGWRRLKHAPSLVREPRRRRPRMLLHMLMKVSMPHLRTVLFASQLSVGLVKDRCSVHEHRSPMSLTCGWRVMKLNTADQGDQVE